MTFPLTPRPRASGPGTTLALTQDSTGENPLIGDLHFENGQVILWDKHDARRQKVRMILQFGLGEYWLNPDEGIPYIGRVIGTKQKGAVLGIFRKAFHQGLPDLAEVRTLTLDFEPVKRVARIGFELRFDDGLILRSSDFSPLELKF